MELKTKEMEEIDKLIAKIESESIIHYTYEEIIEMLEDLKHNLKNTKQ
jgi:hypothetical protein